MDLLSKLGLAVTLLFHGSTVLEANLSLAKAPQPKQARMGILSKEKL